MSRACDRFYLPSMFKQYLLLCIVTADSLSTSLWAVQESASHQLHGDSNAWNMLYGCLFTHVLYIFRFLRLDPTTSPLNSISKVNCSIARCRLKSCQNGIHSLCGHRSVFQNILHIDIYQGLWREPLIFYFSQLISRKTRLSTLWLLKFCQRPPEL